MEIVRKRLLKTLHHSKLKYVPKCDRDVEKRHRLEDDENKMRHARKRKITVDVCIHFQKKVPRFTPFCIFFSCPTKPEICKDLLYFSHIKRRREGFYNTKKKNRLISEHKQYIVLCVQYILNMFLHKHNIHVKAISLLIKTLGKAWREKKKRMCSIYTILKDEDQSTSNALVLKAVISIFVRNIKQ